MAVDTDLRNFDRSSLWIVMGAEGSLYPSGTSSGAALTRTFDNDNMAIISVMNSNVFFFIFYDLKEILHKDSDFSDNHNDSTWNFFSPKFTLLIHKMPKSTINKGEKQHEEIFSLLFHF